MVVQVVTVVEAQEAEVVQEAQEERLEVLAAVRATEENNEKQGKVEAQEDLVTQVAPAAREDRVAQGAVRVKTTMSRVDAGSIGMTRCVIWSKTSFRLRP